MLKKTIIAFAISFAVGQVSLLTIANNPFVVGSAFAAGPCNPEIKDCR